MSQTNAVFLMCIGVVGALLAIWATVSREGVNSVMGIRVMGAITMIFSSLILVGLLWWKP